MTTETTTPADEKHLSILTSHPHWCTDHFCGSGYGPDDRVEWHRGQFERVTCTDDDGESFTITVGFSQFIEDDRDPCDYCPHPATITINGDIPDIPEILRMPPASWMALTNCLIRAAKVVSE